MIAARDDVVEFKPALGFSEWVGEVICEAGGCHTVPECEVGVGTKDGLQLVEWTELGVVCQCCVLMVSEEGIKVVLVLLQEGGIVA